MKNPVKNSTNPHFKNNYINLDGLLDAIKKPLSDNDLFFTQVMIEENEKAYLKTTLYHVSGESIESKIRIQPDKNNCQGLGSALTYLRRYSLEAICGIAGTNDDDGDRDRKGTEENRSQNNEKLKLENEKARLKLKIEKNNADKDNKIKFDLISEIRNKSKIIGSTFETEKEKLNYKTDVVQLRNDWSDLDSKSIDDLQLITNDVNKRLNDIKKEKPTFKLDKEIVSKEENVERK